jgi:uncharacterized protein YndB with AHSA1/START domain
MNGYDIIDERVISASPDLVWAALIAELRGAAQWWVPHNTYEPGAVPPDQVGGTVQVTVHTRGVNRPGLKLRFTARTRSVDRPHRLVVDYVAGVFRGSSEFTLNPVDGGRLTRLSMHFRGQPHGWLRHLARVVDIGQEHSKATQSAFANLDARIGAEHLAERSPR